MFRFDNSLVETQIIKMEKKLFPTDNLHVFFSTADGQTLPINRRQRAYNNGTLVIEQLQRLEDAGTYTCMAQNKQKQTARRNVEIQVLGKFSKIMNFIG